MRLDVLPVVVDMLGQHGHQRRRQGQQDRRVRLAHAQHGRVGIGRLDGLHGREHGLERMVVLDRHDRERYVCGRNGLAVMKNGVFAQMQR
ncbi:hypothetical protein G6F35_018629 [Rhizopus arrhizus]|nr:hypothetical protein G6F35_018629 [Rhizopus arrhizus]